MRDIANFSGYAADTNDRLLARLMNDDDLDFRPEIAFATAGLDAWTRLPNNEMSFVFDGGSQGNHELWVTSARLPHPDGTLRPIQHVPGSG
ncbi:hypothetical protein BTUL_0011g00040 [Botrytis tulipae]|uniref:Uncharacterized protein n=1 Tax=Botrytis tulipae TaxID=87230 RepID=A0A4Z1F5V8_9HELO|nr:hypothetical protein BTUL_0011g00040 [Botrytis tulipae]